METGKWPYNLNCIESRMSPNFLPVTESCYPPLWCVREKWAMKLTFWTDWKLPTQHVLYLSSNCVRNLGVCWTRWRISLLCMLVPPLKSTQKHRIIDSSYCRLMVLNVMTWMQNLYLYHWIFQLAGDRQLCQLLNPQLRVSATTSLQLRRLCPMPDGFSPMTLFTVLSPGHKIARETLH